MDRRRFCRLGIQGSLVTIIGARAMPVVAVELSVPIEAAIEYSRMEAEGRFSELYGHMHSDAKQIVPESAVIGWYENQFFPRGPGVITVTGVRYVSWVWEVTGVLYSNTAEVSFAQPFADGTVLNDVVRLVEEAGEWRWFFGRSLEFVNEQIEIYENQMNLPTHSRVSEPTLPYSEGVPFELLETTLVSHVMLPSGMVMTEVSKSLVGTTNGPLFGVLGEDLGAAWLNVEVASDMPGTGIMMQLAVFANTAGARNHFEDGPLHRFLGNGYFGSSLEYLSSGPILEIEAYVWSGISVTQPISGTANTAPRLGRKLVVAGTLAQFANVLILTHVAVQEPTLTQTYNSDDVSAAFIPAYKLTESVWKFLDTLEY